MKIVKLTFFFFILIIALSCSKSDNSNNNSGGQNQIIVSSFSPTQGYPEDLVIINGENFDPSFSNNKIRFNDINTEIVSISISEIIVKVPQVNPGNYSVSLESSDSTFSIGNYEVLLDKKILTLNPIGEIHEIFISSGRSNLINTIDYEYLVQGNMHAISFDSDIIYMTETTSTFFNITTYNIQNSNTYTKTYNHIEFPELQNANSPAITASHFNPDDGLIYIIIASETLFLGVNTHYVYTFNPQTEILQYSGISFEEDVVNTSLLYNNNIYVISNENNNSFNIIDLENQVTINNSFDISINKLSVKNGTFYGLKNEGSQIELKLVELNINDFSHTELSNNDLGFLNFSGSGFINSNNDYIEFTIVENENNSGFTSYGIYSYNISNNSLNKVYLENQDLGFNTKILKELN